MMCDSNNALWETTDFPYYTYTFYLSKFYEVVDTVIILAKGKRGASSKIRETSERELTPVTVMQQTVALLQSYHHTGAIWTMLALYRSGFVRFLEDCRLY